MIPDEILALRDEEAPERARAAWREADGRITAAAGRIDAATAELEAARAARAELVRQSGSGQTVKPKDIADADARIAAAERSIAFETEARDAAIAARADADAALRSMTADSWRPVLEAGIAIRIRAAEAVFEAKRALRDAEEVFGLGVEIVNEAVSRGADPKLDINAATNPEGIRAALDPEMAHPGTEKAIWARHSFKVHPVVAKMLGEDEAA